jgi:Cytochrome C oxidase, cbb3-type, subunit III
MSRLREALGHPFWQAILLTAFAYAVFTVGIAYVPPLFGVPSAPVPQSVVVQYMLIALVGILIYVSGDEQRWQRFSEPIHTTLVDRDKRVLRAVLLVLVPLLVGFVVFDRVRPRVSAPIQLRSMHPAPPGQIAFRGRTMPLTRLENPLRTRGNLEEHYEVGRRVYVQNCVSCHGDRLDGGGHWAGAFSPAPASFTDPGTIAMLTESVIFWRIAKGGRGLPREGAPWNSAMPVWEDFLTEDEIWSVSIYLFEQTGRQPRAWEEEEETER